MEETLKKQKNSHIVVTLLLVFGLLSITLGVSVAFFNYTRTGSENVLAVGRIYFTSSQGTSINLSNVFPVKSTELENNPNVGSVTLTITGDTTYDEGLEYLISADQVVNGTSSVHVPIGIDVVVSNLGANDDDYLENRGGNSSIYKVLVEDSITDNDDLLIGYIAKGSEGINGTITIKAFIDGDKIAISDTYVKSKPIYRYNANMTAEEMDYCVDYVANDWGFAGYWDTGGTAMSFCEGTGTVYGNNFSGFLDSYYNHAANASRSGSTYFREEDLSFFLEHNIIYNTEENSSWARGRTVLTTNEWNLFYSNGLSFKLRVEANEGIWVKETLRNVIAQQISNEYVKSYDDILKYNPTYTTQDTVENNINKKTVYYYAGSTAIDYANVLFAGFCWQVVRTTDTGGVKLLYNGVAQNNKCETTRSATKGVIQENNSTTQDMSMASLYGRSYDYDLVSGEFTIEDSTGLPSSWSTNDTNNNGKEDYKELIGTYTCLSSSSTCSELYYVGRKNESDATQSYVSIYTIGDVAHYSLIGSSSINAASNNLSDFGYMFSDKTFDIKYGFNYNYYYAHASWDSSNSVYILTDISEYEELDKDHRYICDNADCSKVRYYLSYYGSSRYPYILFENGQTLESSLKEVINYKSNINDSDENINIYNSCVKGYLENWYKKELSEYDSYIDNSVVYCNNRSISNFGDWIPNETNKKDSYLYFKEFYFNNDLSCINLTDRFSVLNSDVAPLNYPIGMLTASEIIMSNYYLDYHVYNAAMYSTMSPVVFWLSSNAAIYASGRQHSDVNGYIADQVNYKSGKRAVITLKPGTKLEAGTGTYTDPYIVGPIVTRTS